MERKRIFPWKKVAFDEHFSNCTTILVAAAGAGRESVAIAERGARVAAFECNATLCEIGRQLCARRGDAVDFFDSAPDEVPKFGTFDGAIVGWGAYGHIVDRSTRIAFLQSLRSQIDVDGPILVSAISSASVWRMHYIAATIGNAVRSLRGKTERVELGDKLRHAFYHRFTPAEMAAEMEEAGFRVLRFEGPYLNIVAAA